MVVVFDRYIKEWEYKLLSRRKKLVIARPTYQQFQYNPEKWISKESDHIMASTGTVNVVIKVPKSFSAENIRLYNADDFYVKRLSELDSDDYNSLGLGGTLDNQKAKFINLWSHEYPNSSPVSTPDYQFDPWVMLFSIS